jgi:hypothetical protein
MIKKCPNKAGGHERVPKIFERAIKITNIMMLKTKRRKNPTLEGHRGPFCKSIPRYINV